MLCVLEKKNADAPWWPRLTTNKVNFVKTDFAKWKDEDEEDEDVSEDPMYNGMVSYKDTFNGCRISFLAWTFPTLACREKRRRRRMKRCPPWSKAVTRTRDFFNHRHR
jgi:hypothetical protein